MGLRTSIVDMGKVRPQSPRAQHQVSSLLAKRQILNPTGNLLVFLLGDSSLSPGPLMDRLWELDCGQMGHQFPCESRNTWTGSKTSELWKETSEAVDLASG